jgi:hypothetical protein
VLVERPYHTDSFYTLNAGADAFCIAAAPRPAAAAAAGSPAPAPNATRPARLTAAAGAAGGIGDCRGGNNRGGRAAPPGREAAVDFLWAPLEPDAAAVAALQPTVLVGGVHYWARDSRPRLAAALEAAAAAAAPGLRQVVWTATPATALPNMPAWDAPRRRRNALLREWAAAGPGPPTPGAPGPAKPASNATGPAASGNTTGRSAGSGAPARGVRRTVLPMDRLADAGRFQRLQQVGRRRRAWRNRLAHQDLRKPPLAQLSPPPAPSSSRQCQDGMHWGCQFEGLVPDFPRINATRWRAPAGGDCRDVVDLNLVQLLLNAICEDGATSAASTAAGAGGSSGAGERGAEPAAGRAESVWQGEAEDGGGAPALNGLAQRPSPAHTHRHFTTAWQRWR